MEKIYTAEINVNGIVGYVGGSNADDLAQGVKACAKAIEEKTGISNEPCNCSCCCCDNESEDDELEAMVLGICSALGIDI